MDEYTSTHWYKCTSYTLDIHIEDYDRCPEDICVWADIRVDTDPFYINFCINNIAWDFRRGTHTNEDIGYYLQHGRWPDLNPEIIDDSFRTDEQKAEMAALRARLQLTLAMCNYEQEWKLHEYTNGSKYMTCMRDDDEHYTEFDLDFICDVVDNIEKFIVNLGGYN
jgi:hypothetical protein